MKTETKVEGLALCRKVVWSKGNFVIASFDLLEDGKPPYTFTMKGTMFVKEGAKYKVSGHLDTKGKYDNSYNAISVAQDIDLGQASRKDLEQFFGTIISKKLAKELLDTLEDPIKVLESADVEKLVTVKGLGVARSEKLIELYNSQKDYSQAYIDLAKYELTEKAIKKICDHFGSVDRAIQVVTDNPYEVVEVRDFGFKKADMMFLNDQDNVASDIRRVRAYVDFLFEEELENGNTWISAAIFVSKFKEFLPMADVRDAITYFNESGKFMTINTPDDKDNPKKLTTHKAVMLEMEIAWQIKRLNDNASAMELNDYEDIIRRVEQAQGWTYTEEQRGAIDTMLTSNVLMIQGLAGTGKSSVANGFLSVVESNGYSFMQCALSGKAASNLEKVTGKKGSTIHSMLSIDFATGGFVHNLKNPLPANVVILDELSMVSADIFLALLKAIPTGGKLIMLGDYGQLDSIGVGVMGGMIRSGVIPMTLLKQIHRQAAKSAIITHSFSFRQGHLPDELKLKAGTEAIYGENQDSQYIFVSNDREDEILAKTMASFKSSIEEYGVDGVQIICSTKTTGVVSTYKLNEYAQMIANPSDSDKEELELGYKDNKFVIRSGDKVINLKNNGGTFSPEGVPRAIYNGNTGIVTDVDVAERSITVDFDGIGEVVVTSEGIEQINLGYAITVHKSQGSTIPCVIFSMPFHYLLNSREFVYTGGTRASQKQVYITSPKSLRDALKKTSSKKKKTNLAIFLKDTDKWIKELEIENAFKKGR